MKNYYDLKIDLKGWKLRKKQLEKQIQELELIVSNTSNTSNENQKTYVGNSTEKKYITYIDLKIKYKKELVFCNKQIKLISESLKNAESLVRKMKSEDSKIFIYYFIDNLKVRTIAYKMGYSQEKIYKTIKKIKNELGDKYDK